MRREDIKNKSIWFCCFILSVLLLSCNPDKNTNINTSINDKTKIKEEKQTPELAKFMEEHRTFISRPSPENDGTAADGKKASPNPHVYGFMHGEQPNWALLCLNQDKDFDRNTTPIEIRIDFIPGNAHGQISFSCENSEDKIWSRKSLGFDYNAQTLPDGALKIKITHISDYKDLQGANGSGFENSLDFFINADWIYKNDMLMGTCLFKRDLGKKKFATTKDLDGAIKYITSTGGGYSLAREVDGMLFVFKPKSLRGEHYKSFVEF